MGDGFAMKATLKSGALTTWRPKDSPEQRTRQQGSKRAAAAKKKKTRRQAGFGFEVKVAKRGAHVGGPLAKRASCSSFVAAKSGKADLVLNVDYVRFRRLPPMTLAPRSDAGELTDYALSDAELLKKLGL